MKRLCFLSFTIVLVTLLTSCYPVFKSPLAQDPIAVDETFLGDWVAYENGRLTKQLQITPAGKNWYNIIFVYEIEKSVNERLKMLLYRGYSSTIDGRTFANVTSFIEDDGYVIAEYKLNQTGELEIAFISKNKIRALIESKKIKGEIREGNILKGELESVIVTSRSNEILALLKDTAPEQLYDDEIYSHLSFTRPKDH